MATAAGKTNWFAIWVTAAVVVVVVVVGGLVWWANSVASAPGVVPQASNVDTESGAIVYGEGPAVVETYVDFMCPYCGQFEKAEGREIQRLIDDGSITLKVHPVSALDNLSQGTQFSSRSAAAMFAVATADPANSYVFLQAMYDNQPAESSPGLTDEEIVKIARDAGVDVTAALEESIMTGEYIDYAKAQKLPEGARGTPTLVVNGEIVPVTYDPKADIVSRIS